MAKRKSRKQSGPRPESLFSQIVRTSDKRDPTYYVRICADVTYDGEPRPYAIQTGSRFNFRLEGMPPLNFLSNMGTEVDGHYIFPGETRKIRVDVLSDEEGMSLLRVGATFWLSTVSNVYATGIVTAFEIDPKEPLNLKFEHITS